MNVDNKSVIEHLSQGLEDTLSLLGFIFHESHQFTVARIL